MKDMIAYCGLDCEACDAYLASVHHDDELREKTAKLWSEMNHAPITAQMINCMGCKADGAKTPFCESMCKIRQCAMKKRFNTCGDCPEFETCQTLRPILEISPKARENLK